MIPLPELVKRSRCFDGVGQCFRMSCLQLWARNGCVRLPVVMVSLVFYVLCDYVEGCDLRKPGNSKPFSTPRYFSNQQGVERYHHLRRNLAEVDNCYLNHDLVAFPSEFARVLHQEGISAIRPRASLIVFWLHSSCNTFLSPLRLSHFC
jgi:hypothetical protein